MEVLDYINANFPPADGQEEGNKAAFGRAFKSLTGACRSPTAVTKILNKSDQYRVVDIDGFDTLVIISAVRLELV